MATLTRRALIWVLSWVTGLKFLHAAIVRNGGGLASIESGDYSDSTNMEIVNTNLVYVNRSLLSHIPNVITLKFRSHAQLESFALDALSPLTSLQNLAIEGTVLNQLPNLQPVRATLKTLSIRRCQFTSITTNAFHEMLQLKEVAFWRCPLQSIPDFSGISTLTRLQFEFASLKSINHTFLPNSTQVFVVGHNTETIDPVTLTKSMPKLTYLTLKQCNLTQLNMNKIFESCHNVQKVNFEHNELRNFPDAQTCQGSFTELNLKYNNIFNISADLLANYTKLKILHLQYNPLAALPTLTDDLMPAMEHLYIAFRSSNTTVNVQVPTQQLTSNNALMRVFPMLSDRVEIASFGQNDIEDIPASAFTNNSRLQNLNLKQNSLHSFPPIVTLQRLTRLDLTNNALTNLSWIQANPDNLNVSELPLQNLVLSYMPSLANVTETSLWQRLKHLSSLSMVGCSLSELPYYLTYVGGTLTHLYLDRNLLTDLSVEILDDLRQLRHLKLDHNRLHSAPSATLRNMPHLNILGLTNNNFMSLLEPRASPNQRLKVNLQANNITCDTGLCWITSTSVSNDNTVCAYPTEWKGQTLKVALPNLSCPATIIGRLPTPVDFYLRKNRNVSGSGFDLTDPMLYFDAGAREVSVSSVLDCCLECTADTTTCAGFAFNVNDMLCWFMEG